MRFGFIIHARPDRSRAVRNEQRPPTSAPGDGSFDALGVTCQSLSCCAPMKSAKRTRREVPSRHRHLFYHLVSEQLHRIGDREPERLGSSEIDDQLEPSWLLDRQVAGLLALENAGNVNAG